ncbi:reverse transcriptase domain-containing protein [Tanacetum coccineum]
MSRRVVFFDNEESLGEDASKQGRIDADVEIFDVGIVTGDERNVTSSKPTKIQEAIRMAHDLIDQVVRFKVAKGVDNKRKWDANQRNNFGKQNKRQEVVRAFTARMGERRRAPNTCFECGMKEHYKSECPNLKNQGRGNQNDSERGRGRVFVIGGGEASQDPNIVMGTFLLNNHYASILFDMGADRSFVSTAFSLLINIASNALDVKYTINLGLMGS